MPDINDLNSQNYKSFFKSETFRSLSPSDRQKLIEFTVDEVHQERGLSDVKTSFFKCNDSNRNTIGACSQSSKGGVLKNHNISFNDSILTSNDPHASYRIYETIHHELEHASQYERSADPGIGNSDPETLEQRLNDRHYYNASGDKVSFLGNNRTPRFDRTTDRQLYRAQATEAEARAAGRRAIEDLKSELGDDEQLDSYIEMSRADEIEENRSMYYQLGTHSRERMAEEELSHLPKGKVSDADAEAVKSYAREKDYAAYKEFVNESEFGLASEDDIKSRFEQDLQFDDFYKSEEYDNKKLKSFGRGQYKMGGYKWDEGAAAQEDFLRDHAPRGGSAAGGGDAEYLRAHAPSEGGSASPSTSDEAFLRAHAPGAEPTPGTDGGEAETASESVSNSSTESGSGSNNGESSGSGEGNGESGSQWMDI